MPTRPHTTELQKLLKNQKKLEEDIASVEAVKSKKKGVPKIVEVKNDVDRAIKEVEKTKRMLNDRKYDHYLISTRFVHSERSYLEKKQNEFGKLGGQFKLDKYLKNKQELKSIKSQIRAIKHPWLHYLLSQINKTPTEQVTNSNPALTNEAVAGLQLPSVETTPNGGVRTTTEVAPTQTLSRESSRSFKTKSPR